MKVVGLDLSLTSTGVARWDGTTYRIRPRAINVARLTEIRSALLPALIGDERADLVVLEDFLESQPSSGRLGTLHGVVRTTLYDLRIPMLSQSGSPGVAPATLKVFATGNGNSGKPEMLAAAQRFLGYGGVDHNEADALWLRELGLYLAGLSVVPRFEEHLRALVGLRLPLAVHAGSGGS